MSQKYCSRRVTRIRGQDTSDIPSHDNPLRTLNRTLSHLALLTWYHQQTPLVRRGLDRQRSHTPSKVRSAGFKQRHEEEKEDSYSGACSTPGSNGQHVCRSFRHFSPGGILCASKNSDHPKPSCRRLFLIFPFSFGRSTRPPTWLIRGAGILSEHQSALLDEVAPLFGVLGFVVHEGVGVVLSVEGRRPTVHARGALVQHQVSWLHGDVVVVSRVVVDHQRPVLLDILPQRGKYMTTGFERQVGQQGGVVFLVLSLARFGRAPNPRIDSWQGDGKISYATQGRAMQPCSSVFFDLCAIFHAVVTCVS